MPSAIGDWSNTLNLRRIKNILSVIVIIFIMFRLQKIVYLFAYPVKILAQRKGL
ncbi:hypothetical protein B4110_1944 [Parageobacillus toebii]|uniref:Uncharacterized protein n=1 Tax=Parageobacillus toebii TaxID=153151 RepID=A0A150N6B9_9BACL|nr:hypothetical protein B4110_1944 [Parageobacillus toebii]